MKTITTLDLHTGGEPLRIITGGIGAPPGATILERRAHAQQHLDGLRRSLMFEPRGHADMYGAIVMPAPTPDGHLGVLFMHNEGWSSMCGHGIIALGTALGEGWLDLPWLAANTGEPAVYNIDAPAGRILTRVHRANGRVTHVSFENVPSFAAALNQQVQVPGLGAITFDIGYGGAFYTYVDVDAHPALAALTLDAQGYRALIDIGMRIKRATAQHPAIAHPFDAPLSFLYGTIFHSRAQATAGVDSRNVCIFAEGEVDRSPTGTGVSGRVALEHAKGRLHVGEQMTIESIVGSRFTARIAHETNFGPHRAIVPEVSGRAWISGRHSFVFDDGDPLAAGFILR